MNVLKSPCATCPYRRDVPAGIWHPTEYAKLAEFDESPGPLKTFLCHNSPDTPGDTACRGSVRRGRRAALLLGEGSRRGGLGGMQAAERRGSAVDAKVSSGARPAFVSTRLQGLGSCHFYSAFTFVLSQASTPPAAAAFDNRQERRSMAEGSLPISTDAHSAVKRIRFRAALKRR